MIYHIFKGAPQIANPKIKEILRFYKRFRRNPHGAATPATLPLSASLKHGCWDSVAAGWLGRSCFARSSWCRCCVSSSRYCF